MKLIYSYTTRMGNYDNNDYQMQFYRASIIRSKQLGYTIKLYGCDYTYNKLKDVVDEWVDITTKEFILTDDLKIFIHSNENLNCITIDGDLILESNLILSENCDLIVDRIGRTKLKSLTKFQKYLTIFKDYDITTNVNYFNYNIPYACGVGILKFNNIETKQLFLSTYYNFRDYFLNNIKPDIRLQKTDDPSIIICEYMFACLLYGTNRTGGECSSINNYVHYMSDKKFTQTALKHIDSILNPSTKII